jgi:hypothetical protein
VGDLFRVTTSSILVGGGDGLLSRLLEKMSAKSFVFGDGLGDVVELSLEAVPLLLYLDLD